MIQEATNRTIPMSTMAGGLTALTLAAALLWSAGCGRDEASLPPPPPQSQVKTNQMGKDAFSAAERLVGLSLQAQASITVTLSDPTKHRNTGFRPQSDGTWKTWGWVEYPGESGKPTRQEWRAVMQHVGAGRKWRGLWLRLGDQESGDPKSWIKER